MNLNIIFSLLMVLENFVTILRLTTEIFPFTIGRQNKISLVNLKGKKEMSTLLTHKKRKKKNKM